MGRCKSLGLLKSLLSYSSQLSGAFSHPCCPHPISSAVTMRSDWWLHYNRHCSSWAPSEQRNSYLGAGITDGCDILVYWYGKKCPISQCCQAVCLPGGSRGTNILFHLVTFSGCLHSWAHGHTCPSSKPAMAGQFLLTLISLTSFSSSFFL